MEPITGILLALGALVAVAILKWDDIQNWMNANKTSMHNIGAVLKTELSTGRVAVCSGVFSSTGNLNSAIAWKPKQIEPELDRMLKMDNMIEIKL